MNWINYLGTVATVIVSADVASSCMRTVFFSNRFRRWKYRKRWGAVPGAVAHFDAVAMAAVGDAWDAPTRHSSTILPNPFDPRTREALAAETDMEAHEDGARRPTFRRSIVLQQKIAQHERALAVLGPKSPEPWEETRAPFLPPEGGILAQHFEALGLWHLQEARLS
ncbi:MAG TPA: hypothetical protein VGI29_02230 [Candidatus Binataceae bacterium]|jgi:hypothetical protein